MSPTGKQKVLDSFVAIRLPKKLRQKLEQLAAKDNRSLSDFCRLALEELVKDKSK